MAQPKEGIATAGFVVSLMSVVGMLEFPTVGLPLALIAIGLGLFAVRGRSGSPYPRRMGYAAMVTGSLALAFLLFLLVFGSGSETCVFVGGSDRPTTSTCISP